MRVDVRPVSRLRGKDPVSLTAALGPVIEALCAGTADLSRLSVVCDWIQYRSSFREVADLRPVLAADPVPGPRPPESGLEVAIDLRRCADADLRALVDGLLDEHASPQSSTRVPLESWVPGRQSCWPYPRPSSLRVAPCCTPARSRRAWWSMPAGCAETWTRPAAGSWRRR